MARKYIRYSAEELDWIKAHCTLPRIELRAEFVAKFARADVAVAQITSLCKRKGWHTGRTGGFRPGERRPDHPARKGFAAPGCEKGWFKKGENTGTKHRFYQPIGAERISNDGYLSRKINDDLPRHKRWKSVHVINWEAVNGPIPDDHRLKCVDGNKTNCAADNWIALPFSMSLLLNGREYDTAPAEVKPTIMATAQLHDRINKIKQSAGKAG